MSQIDVHILEDIGRVQITVDGHYVQFPRAQTTELIAKILRANADSIPEAATRQGDERLFPQDDAADVSSYNVVELDSWSRKV